MRENNVKELRIFGGGITCRYTRGRVSYLVRNMAAQRLVRGDATLDPFMRIVPSLEVRGL
jgi:hypothetical protein